MWVGWGGGGGGGGGGLNFFIKTFRWVSKLIAMYILTVTSRAKTI